MKKGPPDSTGIETLSTWTPTLIFCCLVLTALLSYRATKGLIEDNTSVIHTQEVIEQVLISTSSLNIAESGQRGYILTGDQLYLEKYHQSLQLVDKHLQELKALTVDNSARQVQVEQLAVLVKRRVAIMQSVLDSYRTDGLEQGKQVLIHGGGLQTMTELMAVAQQIYTDEKKLLRDRSTNSIQSRDYALNSFIIGGIFSTTLVLFCYYILINDLRHRKQVAQELAKARDKLEQRVMERTLELEQSNRELQEFAFVASHDLQEPLRKIQVFGDRLRDKTSVQLDGSALDYLARMQNAAKRMQSLINDLLMFSRVSSDQRPLESVDLNLIAKEVLSDLEGSVEHYGGQVDVVHPLPVINADPLQMRQLLQNIVSNALKFHRLDVAPEVSIIWQNRLNFEDFQTSEKFYEIAISDNGIGIDQQYFEKIFVPFQRLHGKSEYEGTGIGLSVCRKIIERHHGYIRVMTNPSGQGTVLTIGFPVNV
jgi:signal transduction histidine kinase